jgi:Icc-related predicted phosphoesterase
MGYYPYVTDPEELEELAGDSAAQEAIFKGLMKERMRECLQFAEERLEGTGIRCYVQPGNDDEFDIDELFEGGRNAMNPEGKIIQIDEHYTMISTGFGNVTPWRCPRDLPEEELRVVIDSMAREVKDFEHSIFNFHCPPHDTVLDQAPQLDDQMRPTLELGGRPHMVPVGSRAVRQAIDQYQPRLGLHGHIHESRGTQKLGRTVCLNPGSEYGKACCGGHHRHRQEGRQALHSLPARLSGAGVVARIGALASRTKGGTAEKWITRSSDRRWRSSNGRAARIRSAVGAVAFSSTAPHQDSRSMHRVLTDLDSRPTSRRRR